ncbi:AAA family ATPase, partial [Klebsiella pneumoniae]
MINNISIHNFKSLNTSDPIEMGSCLFLCGPNSSGKSSFIQAILMIAQTFSRNYKDGRVVLNGGFIKLGVFENILSYSTDSNEILISFELFPENEFLKKYGIQKIYLEFSFGAIDSDVDKRQYNPELNRVKVIAFSNNGGLANLNHKLSFEVEKSSLIRLDLYGEDIADLEKVYPGYVFTGVSKFDGFIPTKIQLNYQVSKKISQDLIPLMINEEKFLFKKNIFKDV